MQRTQIYLGDEQHRVLAALAKERRTTASAVIRDAIDAYLAAQLSPQDRLQQLRALGARLAGSDGPEARDSATTVDSIRTGDATRLNSLP